MYATPETRGIFGDLQHIFPENKVSILIFYEANFVARKTRAQLDQSPRNFPDIFVFTVPNAIEILFFQIHPKCGVMGQSGKVKGSRDSPYEMEATESEESEERDKTGGLGEVQL